MLRILTLTVFLAAQSHISAAQDYHIENLSDLLKAARIAPHNAIVLNYVTHYHVQTGDSKNAIRFYKLTQKYGSGDVKESARRKLSELKE